MITTIQIRENVKNQLDKIFDTRFQSVESRFGKWK